MLSIRRMLKKKVYVKTLARISSIREHNIR